jgi:hypothetical protein
MFPRTASWAGPADKALAYHAERKSKLSLAHGLQKTKTDARVRMTLPRSRPNEFKGCTHWKKLAILVLSGSVIRSDSVSKLTTTVLYKPMVITAKTWKKFVLDLQGEHVITEKIYSLASQDGFRSDVRQ